MRTLIRKTTSTLVLLAVALVGIASSLWGQQDDTPRMTDAQCLAVSHAVDSGNLWAIKRGPLEQCGARGANAVAAVFRKSVVNPPVGLMDAIVAYAQRARDAEVLTLARATARNASASMIARVTSLYVLATYYERDGFFLQSLEELARGPVDCRTISTGSPVRRPKTIRPLPSDANSAMASTIDSIVRDASAPAQLRKMAKCIRFAMYRTVPSNMPPNALVLRYDCGNQFTVTNTLDEPVIGKWVTVTLQDTVLNWEFGMNRRGTDTLVMPRRGVVQILENGKVIAAAENTGKVCPPINMRRDTTRK